MEKRVVRILPQAKTHLNRQILWYRLERDESFVRTMLKNITSDIDTLCSFPTIGRVIPTNAKREYRVFVSHKKCLIKYWYNTRTLYIVDIVFSEIHTPRLF